MLETNNIALQEAVLTRASVEPGIRKVVAEILRMQKRENEIRLESNLFELGLESLNVIELLTAIEMTFDITIDVEDLSGELFENFGNLVSFVEDKVVE